MAEDVEVTPAQTGSTPRTRPVKRRRQLPSLKSSLSGKVLLLTIVFVMIAEVVIFVPSVANMRVRWLSDQLNKAAAASIVLDGLNEMTPPRVVQEDVLMATGLKAIALRRNGVSRLIAESAIPGSVERQFDLSGFEPFQTIYDAFEVFFIGGDRIIRVYGPIETIRGDAIVDIALEEAPLKQAMLIYGRNVLLLSLIISFITACLVFLAIERMTIRPIRRMTENMMAFSQAPEDPGRVIVPREGQDELALAEFHLAGMQKDLQRTLRQKKRLADLGLAVSKINHDMRNILTSAQLISDRLSAVDDPVVKRFAPKLLRTIDRALSYSSEVLSFGKAREAEPNRRLVPLAAIVDDVHETLALKALDPQAGIEFVTDVPADLEVDADSEQLFRVIHNLSCNAIEALQSDRNKDQTSPRRLTISARREDNTVHIFVDDTGPGMPAVARENLFSAFRGSARPGGTGLGLTIARELVLAHGGNIALKEDGGPGTCFVIELPDRPVVRNRQRAKA